MTGDSHNPDDSRDSGGRSAIGRVRRGGQVGGVVARHAARSALASAISPLRSPEADAAAREAVLLKLADDIVATAGAMRGAAHKLGQVIALVGAGIASEQTRAEFSRRLAPLFNAVPQWDDAAMHAVLRRSLGRRFDDIETIEGPVASASIGQVYRARLRDGRDVAVKVKYPDIDHMVRADLKNLRVLGRVLAPYMSVANSKSIVEEVIRQISAELDFRAEARHQHAYALRYVDHPAFRIPDVVEDLCTNAVLVSEWLDGIGFDDACDMGDAQRDAVGEIVYRFYCGEMYRIGHFVADPHPGNVLVLPDGRVGFVDYGLCVELSPEQLLVERTIFSALLRQDRAEVYRLAQAAGFVGQTDETSPDVLWKYITSAVGWHLSPGVRTLSPDDAAESAAAALLMRGEDSAALGSQTLIEAHAFGRRNELATSALLGRLRATGPWSAIAREVLGLAGPATALGAEIAQWLTRSRQS